MGVTAINLTKIERQIEMVNADQYERYMLDLINADRAQRGADPLLLERNLNQAAEDHSEWMLARDIFDHTGVGGSSPTKRITDAGFDLSGGWRTAENIAVQSERGAAGIRDDVADLHQSLMNSPGHFRNLMNPDLDYIGIGIELGDFNYGSGAYESVIVTQNFATTGGKIDLDTGGERREDDVLMGTARADRLFGGAGNDEIRGHGGRDVIGGGTGADLLYGGRAADDIQGGQGNDRIFAGFGKDILRGGQGNDQLHGRGGEDRFVFRPGDDRDTVHDFVNNRDVIDLQAFDFANKAKALSEARDTGDDVTFYFGDGDRLTILNTEIGALKNDLLI